MTLVRSLLLLLVVAIVSTTSAAASVCLDFCDNNYSQHSTIEMCHQACVERTHIFPKCDCFPKGMLKKFFMPHDDKFAVICSATCGLAHFAQGHDSCDDHEKVFAGTVSSCTAMRSLQQAYQTSHNVYKNVLKQKNVPALFIKPCEQEAFHQPYQYECAVHAMRCKGKLLTCEY
jgi:hypothetical protein